LIFVDSVDHLQIGVTLLRSGVWFSLCFLCLVVAADLSKATFMIIPYCT